LTASFARSYQWYHNGSSINGATNNAYSTPSCGDYYVRIYDDNGCYKELTYFYSTGQPSAPTITALGNKSTCTGSSLTLLSSAAPGGFGYQWIRNSVEIAGATSRDYTTA